MSRETELLEQLEHCDDASTFLLCSNELINIKLKALLPYVFVQDPMVMEQAVTPLLKEDGPLSSSDVVSKLMFALGKITRHTYADIVLYKQVFDFAKSQPKAIGFGDEIVFDFIDNQALLALQQNRFYIESIKNLKFSSFEVYSQLKYESLVKTVLKLALEMLLDRVENEVMNKE